jgi:hypothetical protein
MAFAGNRGREPWRKKNKNFVKRNPNRACIHLFEECVMSNKQVAFGMGTSRTCLNSGFMMISPAEYGDKIMDHESSQVKLLITEPIMHFALCKEQQHSQKQEFFVVMV